MKSLVPITLFLFLASTCLAERTIAVVVTVKNQSGEPIYIILGKDDQSENAVGDPWDWKHPIGPIKSGQSKELTFKSPMDQLWVMFKSPTADGLPGDTFHARFYFRTDRTDAKAIERVERVVKPRR
jgi:hypothetical protein